ncbi:hypothetical protein RSPO_m00435 (plasmid) [Ralstonia solanacearum Po82]|uniref:Uncharacterized protein n=1 Tax=Ralstonia solanacearum (strain Po82) TaxID=1031711 RepID=F6G8I5_RALS8|nr:hypothetical protein RSPO_m00435 [Ralstonia solanacearum Po82]
MRTAELMNTSDQSPYPNALSCCITVLLRVDTIWLGSQMLMMSMAVTTMHEQVHERTCGEQQEWQERNDVGPMLAPKEIRDDQQKADQYQLRSCDSRCGLARLPMLVAFHIRLRSERFDQPSYVFQYWRHGER